MSFPITFQHDSMQCGIACLQMICRHFGRKFSLDFLSKLCFASNEGVSLLGINDAANKLGLKTLCVKASMNELIFSWKESIGTWKLNKTINKNGFCLYLSENLFKFAMSFGILLFLHSSIKIREISDIENMGN